MAITNITSSTKSASVPASKQIGASGAAPASTGKVPGAYDRFRGQRPNDIPQEWWDQYIDAQNSSYQRYVTEHPNEKAAVDKQLAAYTIDQISTAARNTSPEDLKRVGGTFAPSVSATEAASQSERDDLLNQILGSSKEAREANQSFVDQNVTPALDAQRRAADDAYWNDQTSQITAARAGDAASKRNAGIASQVGKDVSASNSDAEDIFDDYVGRVDQLDSSDRGAVDQLQRETQGLLNQRGAAGYGSNVDSDPEGLAAQRGSLRTAQNIAAGGANIAAGGANITAERYGSDRQDVARQNQSYQDLGAVGSGFLDEESEAAKARADQQDIDAQRRAYADLRADLLDGDKDQRELFDLAKSRTGVEPTAEEDLLYEINRRERESKEKSSRDGALDSLMGRGILSGAAAASLKARGNQDDVLLADMAANAQAVKRSTDYTQLAGQLANQLRDSKQNTLGQQSDLATDIRNQSFDEAFKRGSGADQITQGNQQVKLSGIKGQADQINSIRGSNDQVARDNAAAGNAAAAQNQGAKISGAQLQAGVSTDLRNANDAMNQFNKEQSLIQQRFQDEYAQNEAKRVADVADQRFTGTTGVNQTIGLRAADLSSSGQQMVNDNSTRSKQATDASQYASDKDYGYDIDEADRFKQGSEDAYGKTKDITGASTNIAGVRAGINQQGSQSDIDALKLALGINELDEAQRKSGK